MRKVILMFAFVTALFTAVNSAVANLPIPTCGDNCPFVK
jgi:hypothetical protein